MNRTQAMAELKAAGTAQNRKVYARHGIAAPMFGVSFANLGRIHKQIKTDHALACQLWATGNHDARVLATMIADPAQVDNKLAEAWVKDLDNYVLTDAFSGMIRRGKLALRKADKWSASKHEWIGRAGWNLIAGLALYDPVIKDDYFAAYLPIIARDIHTRPNRTRDAMNSALIAIGVRNPKLRKQAMAVAQSVGQVDVDHGETSCKTPDAAAYIHKTLAHRRAQAAKQKKRAPRAKVKVKAKAKVKAIPKAKAKAKAKR